MNTTQEFTDEETGIRLVYTPESEPQLTAFAPDDTSHLTGEQIQSGLARLLEKVREYQISLLPDNTAHTDTDSQEE